MLTPSKADKLRDHLVQILPLFAIFAMITEDFKKQKWIDFLQVAFENRKL